MYLFFLKKYKRYAICLTSMFLIWNVAVNCQVSGTSKKSIVELGNKIFSKNHISISITPYIAEQAAVGRSNTNNYNIHSSSQPGIEAGLNYHLNFNEPYAFIFGIKAGIIGRDVQYRIPKEDFDPPAEKDLFFDGAFSKSMDVSYTSLQLLLQRRWVRAERGYWNIDAGVNLRYSLDNSLLYVGTYVPNSSDTLFGTKLYFGNNRKPWLNYNLGGGYSWVLKKRNILQVNLHTNLSFIQFVKGSYRFTVPNKPVETGSYGIKGSFIGLSFSYIFTGARKKLQKTGFTD
jgi:hypothetical protein